VRGAVRDGSVRDGEGHTVRGAVRDGSERDGEVHTVGMQHYGFASPLDAPP
jgi:hypothetical protein